MTTGRRVAAGEADGLRNFVVMLDNHAGWKRFAAEDADIYWGAYLGTPDQVLIAGKVSAVSDEIFARPSGGPREAWVDHGHLPDPPA